MLDGYEGLVMAIGLSGVQYYSGSNWVSKARGRSEIASPITTEFYDTKSYYHSVLEYLSM